MPETVRDELASRAVARGESIEGFVRAELRHTTSIPDDLVPKNLPPNEWIEEVCAHKAPMQLRVTAESILRHRDADRT